MDDNALLSAAVSVTYAHHLMEIQGFSTQNNSSGAPHLEATSIADIEDTTFTTELKDSELVKWLGNVKTNDDFFSPLNFESI